MIAHLQGKLLSKTPTQSIVDCHGVGYEVNHTPDTAEKLNNPNHISLYIYTHVREDIFQLYGFLSVEERDFFKELLKVSAVGPKLAISILSGIQYEELLSALQNKDVTRLQKIPGIGKKTAERLSIELADRVLKKWKSSAVNISSTHSSSKEAELESVLMNLGYQSKEVLKVVGSLKKELNSEALETVVKKALGELTAIKKMRVQ